MNRRSYDGTLVALFAALTVVGAFVQFPLPVVPITFQTLFTYLAGAVLGSRRGALSQIVYVLIGIAGAPVFSGNRAGLGVLFGPTGGYLIGFIVGAYAIGRMCETNRNETFLWVLLSMLVGTTIIYLFGVIQLTFWLGSLTMAIIVGVLPFLIGDAIKMVIAAYLTLKLSASITTVPP